MLPLPTPLELLLNVAVPLNHYYEKHHNMISIEGRTRTLKVYYEPEIEQAVYKYTIYQDVAGQNKYLCEVSFVSNPVTYALKTILESLLN